MSSVVFRVISHLILVALIAISSLRNAPCFRSFKAFLKLIILSEGISG